jgi:hypothetical protein
MNATGIGAAATPTELDTSPKDQLGIWMTGSIVVGSMIGSGIFM